MGRMSPIRRVSKRPMRQLELKADALLSKLLRQIWNNHCAMCRKVRNTHPHHIIKSRSKQHRHAVMDCIPLCDYPCHRWAEEHPYDFSEWLKENYPEHYAWNQRHRNDPVKVRMEYELRETIEELRSVIRNMKETDHE